jgi:transcriptional regulator with XRE-family HTH domain
MSQYLLATRKGMLLKIVETFSLCVRHGSSYMKLKEYLKENGRTSVWFAKKLNVTTTTLSKWINDKRKPSNAYIYMIEQKTEGNVTEKDWEIEK